MSDFPENLSVGVISSNSYANKSTLERIPVRSGAPIVRRTDDSAWSRFQVRWSFDALEFQAFKQWYIGNQYGAQSFNIVLRDQDEYFARYLMNFDSVYEWSRNGKRYSVTASLIGVFVLRLPEPAPITTAPHVFTFDESSGDYQDSGTSSNPFILDRKSFLLGSSLRDDGAGGSAYSGVNAAKTMTNTNGSYNLGGDFTIECMFRIDNFIDRGASNGATSLNVFQVGARTGNQSVSTIEGAFRMGFANYQGAWTAMVPYCAIMNPAANAIDSITDFDSAVVPNGHIYGTSTTLSKIYHLLMTMNSTTRELSFYVDGALVGTSTIVQADYDEWIEPSWYIDDPQDVNLGNPDRIKRNDVQAGANLIEGAFRTPQDGALDQLMFHEVHMDANQAALQASIANLP
jgi:hypothetical protein